MKITIADLPEADAPRRADRLVGRKVRQADGSQVMRYRLDANDSEVADDLLVLFRRNAARARRRRSLLVKKHGIAAE